MSGKFFICLLTTVLLTTGSRAAAQQTGKIYRIGFLSGGFPVRRIGPRDCAQSCNASAMSKAKTYLSNRATRKIGLIASLPWPMNWSILSLMSS